MLCKLCSFVLLSHYYLLSSAQLDSTWFCLFSITIEFHLNVCGVVRATQPKVPWCFFVFFLMQHKHSTTMEVAEAMVYLLFGLWLIVRLGDHCFGFCVAVSHVARFQKWQLCFLWGSRSYDSLNTNQWDAVCWYHIFRLTLLAWNPSWASAKKLPGTRYYHLNPKNWVKLSQVKSGGSE